MSPSTTERPVKESTTSFRPAQGPPIERRAKVSAHEFFRDYALQNRPVVITDVMKDWPALSKWTPQFFADRYPEKVVKFRDKSELPMAAFIKKVLNSTPETPAPYWTNAPVLEHFPELMADINPDLPYFKPNWAGRHFLHPGMRTTLKRGAMIEIYIGGNGGAFPVVHWDGLSTHAFLMQVYGRKRYYVWSPEDSACMYPHGEPPNLSPVRDVENPDLEKYPLFAKARLTTFVLEPGELLFVPSRWWHTAKMLTPSITLSINTLNTSNWKNFTEDMTRNGGTATRLVKGAYLASSRLWNQLRDIAS
jgi:hypothetical protein